MKIKSKNDIRLQALDILSYEGIETLTMSELAKRVGLTKASLYHYYKGKEEILDDIFETGHKSLMHNGFTLKLGGNTEQDLLALSSNWLNLLQSDENYMYMRVLTSMHLTDERAKEEYRALLLMLQGQSEVVMQRISRSDYRLKADLFASLLFSKLEEMLEDRAEEEDVISEIREFADFIEKSQ